MDSTSYWASREKIECLESENLKKKKKKIPSNCCLKNLKPKLGKLIPLEWLSCFLFLFLIWGKLTLILPFENFLIEKHI